MTAPAVLAEYQCLQSQNKAFIALMEGSGNFAVYLRYSVRYRTELTNKSMLWWESKSGNATADNNHLLSLDMNNNMVIYDAKNRDQLFKRPKFATNTGGQGVPPAWMTLQNDGNLVLFDVNNLTLWSSGIRVPTVIGILFRN